MSYSIKMSGAKRLFAPLEGVSQFAAPLFSFFYRTRSCQKATALAAATFRESTPWDMGISTV